MSPVRRAAWPALMLSALLVGGCDEVKVEKRASPQSAAEPRERHLEGVRPLTRDGVNRQASFSRDGRSIVWLRRAVAGDDFAIYTMTADGGNPTFIDTGPGRSHDPAFAPDGLSILCAMSDPRGRDAPRADADDLWLFDPTLDLYSCALDGSTRVALTAAPGYDAEGSWSWGGTKIVFTSLRDGEGALWLMDADGAAQTKLLALPYAGGARISPDGRSVVFHGALIRETREMDIYVADLAGGMPRQLTQLKATSLTPAWHPSQQVIVFASDAADQDFELWMVRPDGSGLERLTWSRGFDGFPCFSPDGQLLIWTSQRGATAEGQTHIWRATWRG